MKIILRPTEIIERALFDKYQKFCLKKETDIEKLINENQEFEIKEEDALVIGLLKVLETDNLVHRCNIYIQEFLATKSVEFEENNKYYYFINKKNLCDVLLNFRKKFPSEWKPSLNYKKALEEVNVYIENLIKKIENLNFITNTDKLGRQNDYVFCNHVKKLLNIY